jgi:hypothetical protein
VRALVIAIVLALSGLGCSEVYPYYFCEDDDQCELDGEQGVCTPYFMCAFYDETCPEPQQLRYHESAELADVCVGDEEDF